MTSLDSFTLGYVASMLASTSISDTDDSPLSDRYSLSDIAPDTLSSIVADCAAFQATNAHALESSYGSRGEYATREADPEYAGHLYWLNRNGHGIGYWGGEWPAPHDDTLSRAATRRGEVWAYIGDDGLVYVM
jgi:hypothetical protein